MLSFLGADKLSDSDYALLIIFLFFMMIFVGFTTDFILKKDGFGPIFNAEICLAGFVLGLYGLNYIYAFQSGHVFSTLQTKDLTTVAFVGGSASVIFLLLCVIVKNRLTR